MPTKVTFPFRDAIIVLANLMDAQGNLNGESRARLELAVKLLRENESSGLITTGWDYRADSSIKIADAFKKTAVEEFGVDENRIVADTNSRDTVGDAVFTKKNVVEGADVKNVTVISTAYHIERVKEVFGFVFGPDYEITYLASEGDGDEKVAISEQASLAAFRRTFDGIRPGDTAAIFERLLSDHPFYNGKSDPRPRYLISTEN